MNYPWGHTKRYNDYSSYIRSTFQGKTQKLSIDAGFTCPNRDGTKSYAGCTYCNNNSFKPAYCKPIKSITDQLEEGIAYFSKRKTPDQYLAYFQAFSNTYESVDVLRRLYQEALNVPGIKGIVISTRPDCIHEPIIELLEELAENNYVALEIGIESCNNDTLQRLNRCHTHEDTLIAIDLCKNKGFELGAHIMLGLPGEDYNTMLRHADELSKMGIKLLKIHQLQIIQKTVMSKQFRDHPSTFHFPSIDEYVHLIVDFLERLSPTIIVERFASQAPYELLIHPKWGLKNFEIARIIENALQLKDTWQGRLASKKNEGVLIR